MLSLGFSQTFAPVGAEWIMGYTVPLTSDQNGYRTITVVGDTIINGIACRIIEGDLGPHTANLFGDNYVYEQGGQVFAYFDQINQFQKIFDFDAIVGDSWNIVVHETATNAVFDTFQITVDSTFIEVLDGDSTKSYLYSLEFLPSEGSQCPGFYDDDYFVGLYDLKANNKLGAGHYLFPVPTSICISDIYDMEWDGHLRCYTDDNITYTSLPASVPNCTYQNISVEEVKQPEQQLVWIMHENLVKVEHQKPEESQFSVYDITGRLFMLQRNVEYIDVSELGTGIYIVEYKTPKQMLTLKISL